MKILQISSVPVTYPGGTEKVIFELSKELAKKNEVTILQTTLYEEGKKFKREEEIHKIKIITCKNDKFLGGYGYSKEFKKTLKKIWKDYDVIHVHGHGRFTSTYTLRKIGKKKPVIYTAHGFFHTEKSGKIKRIYNQYFKLIINNAKYLTALTELEKENYIKLGAKKEKIKIIPNWINIKKFSASKTKKNFGFKNKNPVLLYVGRIHKSKGLQYVLRAIKNLPVNLLIVGKDNGYQENLEDLSRKLEIEKEVKFIGMVDEKTLLGYYNSSDFFVLFSEWEGFGIVVLEAMSFGLPVIVSDRGSLPTLIKNEKNGLVAKFKSIEDLRNKISLLLKNKKIIRIIKKNEKEFVKQFDSKKVIKKYEELYNEATKP